MTVVLIFEPEHKPKTKTGCAFWALRRSDRLRPCGCIDRIDGIAWHFPPIRPSPSVYRGGPASEIRFPVPDLSWSELQSVYLLFCGSIGIEPHRLSRLCSGNSRNLRAGLLELYTRQTPYNSAANFYPTRYRDSSSTMAACQREVKRNFVQSGGNYVERPLTLIPVVFLDSGPGMPCSGMVLRCFLDSSRSSCGLGRDTLLVALGCCSFL